MLEERGNWRRVQGPDDYQGWIQAAQLAEGELSPPTWKIAAPVAVVREVATDKVLGRLPLDARFAGEPVGQRIEFRWPTGEMGWVPKGVVHQAERCGTMNELLQLARTLLGIPYLWGGTSPFGFDCSGFVQRLFHFVFNHWLPRDTDDQIKIGHSINKLEEMRPGDLAFFPGHVGLWLGRGELVHASGSRGLVVTTRLIPSETPYGQWLRAHFRQGRRLMSS